MRFTFWQLVRADDHYVLRPYVTIYDDMIEIASYVNAG